MISGELCHSCEGGKGGSGAIFFTGCNGRCKFCQNYKISQHEMWSKNELREVSNEELFNICRKLIDEGAHNINFISPTPYSNLLLKFLKKYKRKIPVPIIWNSNGYEKASTIRKLKGFVDVYLPDFKYFDDKIAVKYSAMPNYFKYASEAILEMVRQVPSMEIGADGFIKKGLLIRHLVLPGHIKDSKKILKWIFGNLGSKTHVSLMSQYYPIYKACDFPEINRRLTEAEYSEISEYFVGLGFEDGLLQDLSSADLKYTPDLV